jgi:hypothetical protein
MLQSFSHRSRYAVMDVSDELHEFTHEPIQRKRKLSLGAEDDHEERLKEMKPKASDAMSMTASTGPSLAPIKRILERGGPFAGPDFTPTAELVPYLEKVRQDCALFQVFISCARCLISVPSCLHDVHSSKSSLSGQVVSDVRS